NKKIYRVKYKNFITKFYNRLFKKNYLNSFLHLNLFSRKFLFNFLLKSKKQTKRFFEYIKLARNLKKMYKILKKSNFKTAYDKLTLSLQEFENGFMVKCNFGKSKGFRDRIFL